MRETHEHYDTDGALTGTTVVTRESEWDDEQRQIMLEHLDYKRKTARCGHHPIEGMDSGVGRLVEHATVKCLDCAAEEAARKAWHDNRPGHDKDGHCKACADEVFWVDQYVPVD